MIAVLALVPILAASPLELGPLLDEVSAHAPSVRVQRAAVAAARSAVGAAGTWEDPAITVMSEGLPMPGDPGGMSEETMLTYRLSQTLNVFGRRGGAKRVAGAQVRVEEAGQRRAEWDARAQAVALFYELWMNGEMRAILARQIELLDRMREAGLARVRAGTGMGHHDVLRAEAEIRTMEAERASLEAERSAIAAMLNALRGRRQDEPIGEPRLRRATLPSLARVLASAERRPEIQASRAMLSEAQARKELAGKMYLPMVAVEAEYQQRPGMVDSVGVALMFSVPLWFWDRQQNEVAMANAMIRRADEDIAAMRAMTEADLRMAWSRALGAQQRLEALESNAIPKMKETIASTEASYASGMGDFLSLLDATMALRELEGRRANALAQYEVARYALARLSGAELEGSR